MNKVVVLLKFYKGEVSPFDETAMECALQMDGYEKILVSMAPIFNKEKLEYYTRLGFDKAYLISDKMYAGSDTYCTSRILSEFIKHIGPDYCICGRQSIDGDTAQVPAEIAEMLNFKFIPYAMEFSLNKLIQTRIGKRKVNVKSVISVERFLNLRLPSIYSAVKSVEIITNNIIGLKNQDVGYEGSLTVVKEVIPNQKNDRKCKYIGLNYLNIILDNLIKNNKVKKKNFINHNYNKIDKVLIVGKTLSKQAKIVSNKVISITYKELSNIDKIINQNDIKNVLFTASLKNRALAPKIAAKLHYGLAADCIGLETDGDKLYLLRPCFSGNSYAKVYCKSNITMATVRCLINNTKDIAFGIGYGAIEYIDKIKILAEKYNAKIYATRKIVDLNKISYEYQVGLTGKIISPKIYVAFGISGAVQHLVGFENSTFVIAINNDKNAEIFKYCDYGIIGDIKDVEL